MPATRVQTVSAKEEVKLKPSGPAMAVVLSASLGVFVTGLATLLASASPGVKAALNWWDPAGPLTGKTGAGSSPG